MLKTATGFFLEQKPNSASMFEFKIAKCKKRKKKVKNRRYLFEDMLTDHIYEVVQGHTLDRLKGFCKQTKERIIFK